MSFKLFKQKQVKKYDTIIIYYYCMYINKL